jgi:hypothetical protein
MLNRRNMLQLFGGGALGYLARGPLQALANAPAGDDFFIFIHAGGGWDVTLWADPRNERKGIVEPPSTANTDHGHIKLWKPVALDGGVSTFEVLAPSGMRLGPAIGDLYDLRDRLTIVNGIAINTVSHDDGVTYSVTGRHRAGGTIPASSIDVMVANELGTQQLLPAISVRFPSSFVGDALDRRAIPMRMSTAEDLVKSLERSDLYLAPDDRAAIATVLATEARELAAGSTYPPTYEQLAAQHETLPTLLGGDFKQAFTTKQLQAKYPQFNYRSRAQGSGALSAALALEALSRGVVRCVAFRLGGLDTHTTNYRQHATTLQDLFAVVATLIKQLDGMPHPTRTGRKLADHTHVLVVSEFCRAPQINNAGGRDHYPNNSALVISPRFRAGKTFGRSDPEQLLPIAERKFADGMRAPTPADVLATFLGAFKIDPRKYMRDGEVVRDWLV